MDNLKKLLEQLSRIISAEKKVIEERRNKGENYNIFRILKLSKNERKLHSSFLADLLDTKSEHGLKDKFLNAFLKIIKSRIELDGNIEVFKEHYIGPINKENTEGGQLDILIKDNKGNAIIIENKIDADDQDNQLLRYNNFANETFNKYELIYLTPSGCEASDKTTGGKVFDYYPLSYTTILEWIEQCINISAKHPLVRETLIQYSANLKDILDLKNDIDMNEFLNITTSEDYVEATLKIIEKSRDIRQKIIEKFVDNIKTIAIKKGYGVEVDEGFYSLANDKWIKIFKESLGKDYCLVVGWTEHNSSTFGGARIGIKKFNDNINIDYTNLEHVWTERDADHNFPYGWETLGTLSGNWWDWREVPSLRAMANGEMLLSIQKNLLEKDLKDNLLENLCKLSDKK